MWRGVSIKANFTSYRALALAIIRVTRLPESGSISFEGAGTTS